VPVDLTVALTLDRENTLTALHEQDERARAPRATAPTCHTGGTLADEQQDAEDTAAAR